jgi:serine O-acetyltransferase
MANTPFIKDILKELDSTPDPLGSSKSTPIPDRSEIISCIEEIKTVLFPSFYGCSMTVRTPEDRLRWLYERIRAQINAAYLFAGMEGDADSICHSFFESLPKIKDLLGKDIQALYEGDPAAMSKKEVLLCYPGFMAITIYRIAHEFYLLKVPYLSRIMTEYAHEITGIDIHAGATVGEYFFIDHGTGIVIGETTVIGDHVKLYQGVTLGAKSFETDESGNPIKGIKRHPNIGNHVVIYANATILGGDTYVGDGCVIGGNVWLTHSVEANQKVYYSASQSIK